jgi:hypothetical protein
MGYQLETTALISKDNYNAFRITPIMLILRKLNNLTLNIFHIGLTQRNRFKWANSVS